METATVGLQYIFNRPNPQHGTGTITYATTSRGGGLTATRTGLSGIPTTAGSFDFTWTATDGSGATAVFTLTLTVRSSNDPPAFTEDQRLLLGTSRFDGQRNVARRRRGRQL